MRVLVVACLRVKFLLQDREDSKSNPLGASETLDDNLVVGRLESNTFAFNFW